MMTQLVIPKATDSLETWLSYLEKTHFKPIDLGLMRIKKVAQELDLLFPSPYVITVAGTNGKGSTCRLLETVLLKSGYRVGVYSSPHLLKYNERVRIQSQTLDDEQHVASFAFIEAHRSESLTYFEFSTLSALYLFKQAKLDIVILEVGLGGRLDATNIIDPNCAVITSIDIDHTEFLGKDRESIGYEKAGIFRPHIPVIIGDDDCPASILNQAKKLQCKVSLKNRDWQLSLGTDRLHWEDNNHHIDLPIPHIPAQNVATALAVVMQLPFVIADHILQVAVSETTLIGRFQKLMPQEFSLSMQRKVVSEVIIDVGHNPHAARYLASQLITYQRQGKKILAIFSALIDKDLTGIIQPLVDIIDEWHCVGLNNYRGQSGESILSQLKQIAPQAVGFSHLTVKNASEILFAQATTDAIIIVFGSFYTVADFLDFIGYEIRF